jgi:NAD(P)-dependent dehydrogenase (short-subunit alcohol dehydrogenase family)
MAFDNRRFVVLGGTGGIGSEVTRRFIASGAQVMVGARGEEGLRRVADETGARTHQMDATDPEAVDEIFEKATQEFGGLDGAVNCVGTIIVKPAHRTTPKQWDETRAANLDTAFYTVRSAADRMQKGGGTIVLVSTAAAQIGLANHGAIAAAKGGVIGLTRASAATYAKRNVRVNCVAPGLVDTPAAEPLTSNQQSRDYSTSLHPLGRLGKPADIASAIQWLADDDQSWVTGQVLGVDGGLAMLKTRQ